LWRFVRSGILDVVWKGEDGWVVRSRQSMPAKMPVSVPPLPPRSVTPVEAVAAVEETSAPELPPRKRSGWGLGFTFGSAKSSGSAATDSEPATPDEDGDEETKRLTGVPDGDIQKVEMEQGDAEATVPGPSEPAISPSTSHEPEFSTPKGLSPEREEANLPVEVGADADVEVDADAEVHPVETVKEMPTAEETPEQSPAINDLGEGQQTVDISSPRASMDGNVPEEAASTAETPVDTATPLPPPVPRRASRRRIDAAASVSAPIEDVEASPHEETAADEIDPLDETDHSPTTPNAPAPPRLPPRSHTRTTSTNTVIAGSPVTPTGKNQWVEGDGWEAKTWKELVRLKEEMWMARMGLVDSVE
jgi:Rab guanine nucleotide exchange factor SEC2